MARLQILELPEGSGDDRPPFVLVVDQASEDIAKALNPDPSTDEVVSYATAVQRLTGLSLAEQIGARAVLVFEETVDIPANDTGAYLREAEATWSPVDEMEVLRQQARHSEEAEAIRKRVSKEQKAALTDALGMDRLRDWDDILNAARGLRTQRDTQAETLEQVRRLPEQPDVMDAKRPFPAEYLNGYAYAMRAAKRSTYPPQPTEAGETGPADA